MLNDIIEEDQFGFMKGRNIADNIRRTLDAIKLAEKKKVNALLIQIDFMKAFDRVENSSLLALLERLNFGDYITSWIRILFTDIELCTQNNGYSSRYFSLTRRLFQGNPVSSVRFVILIEALAILLRNNDKIEGLKFKNVSLLINMFADDLSLFIQNKEKCWKAVKETLEYFHQISGLKVNYDKSTVYRISGDETNAQKFALNQLKWTDKFTVLGIIISRKEEHLIKNNIEPLIAKAESILKLWRVRGLSLIGKIEIMNSLIASLFVYPLTVLPMCYRLYADQVNLICRNFIWNNGKPKIKMAVLKANKKEGGLGLFDLENKEIALKAQWTIKYDASKIIKGLADEILDNKLDNKIWETQTEPKDIKNVHETSFLSDVRYAWAKLTYHSPQTAEEVEKQEIWLNSKIKIKNRLLLDQKLISKGIHTIGNLRYANRFLTYEQMIDKYDKEIDPIKYYGIISAIPKEWKKILKRNEPGVRESWYQKLKNAKKPVAIIYRSLNENESILEELAQKWTDTLKTAVTKHDLLMYISRIYRMTIYVKMRSFQYKVLMRAIVLNKQLKMYKIQESELCSYCNLKTENLTHIFWECPICYQFLVKFRDWCQVNAIINFSQSNVIFNTVCDNPKTLANLIFLEAKDFVYVNRKEKKLNFDMFKNRIYYIKQIELQIAYERNKVKAHESKWKDLV